MLGNGPSLRGVDLTTLSGVATIGMNAAYREWERIGWFPTHYCCLDEELAATHHASIAALIENRRIDRALLSGRILDFQPQLADNERCLFLESFREQPRMRDRREAHSLPRRRSRALETSAPSKVTTGSYAVRFAVLLGHRTVYLLGIDCNYVERVPGAREAGGMALEMEETPESNPNYFFDDYQREGDRFNVPNPGVHEGNLHLQALEAVRDDFGERGLDARVLNCSAESQLVAEDVFPFAPLSEALGSAS